MVCPGFFETDVKNTLAQFYLKKFFSFERKLIQDIMIIVPRGLYSAGSPMKSQQNVIHKSSQRGDTHFYIGIVTHTSNIGIVSLLRKL